MSPLSCQHSFDHLIGTGNRGARGLCVVVHRHCVVNRTIIVGDSRHVSGCCRIDIHVSICFCAYVTCDITKTAQYQ